MNKIIKRIKELLFVLVPRVYVLPDVIYVNWLNKEFFINR